MYHFSKSACLVFALFIFYTALSKAQLTDFGKNLEEAGVIILEEKTSFTAGGQKADMMTFTVSKEIAYKINKEEGISEIDTFRIPEPFDETYILHAPEIRQNISSISGLKINNFIAEIEKPDGTRIPANPEVKMSSKRIVTTALGEAYFFDYYFKGLEVGDILRINYSYYFLFRDNWHRLISNRVFFHSRYPKLSCDFTLSYPSGLQTDTFLVNLSPPLFKEENGIKTISWHFENLPGCIDEPWSHPYTDLPNFTFSLKPWQLLYEHYNSFKEEFVPLWLLLCYEREKDITYAIIDNSIGAKDKDNLAYAKIAAQFIVKDTTDPTGIKSLQAFQKWLVDNASYDNSIKYYNQDENYKVQRPALDLQGGIMKDFAIEQAYANLILKLGLNFYTAYPADIRCGEMSDRYFSPMYDNDLIFAVILKDNIIAYVVPFSQYNRYFAEEIPFYYENTSAFLVSSYDFGAYKVNIADAARLITTPSSKLADNVRRTVCAATINLDSGSVHFKTSVTLKGQYSTLCRPSYLEKPTDPTIDPKYFDKVWDISDEVVVTKFKPQIKELYFPFETVIDAEYNTRNIVEKKDSLYIIHLTDWINHVVPCNFNPDFRFTDFYPDFKGKDSYMIELTFDHNIKLSGKNLNVYLDKDFGSYSFAIQQTSGNKVLLSSTFVMKNIGIKKDRTGEVFEMLQAINARRSFDIEILSAE